MVHHPVRNGIKVEVGLSFACSATLRRSVSDNQSSLDRTKSDGVEHTRMVNADVARIVGIKFVVKKITPGLAISRSVRRIFGRLVHGLLSRFAVRVFSRFAVRVFSQLLHPCAV